MFDAWIRIFQRLGQAGNRRLLKDRAKTQFFPGLFLDGSNGFDSDQGMSAKSEEAVMNSDRLDRKNIFPNRRQLILYCGFRSVVKPLCAIHEGGSRSTMAFERPIGFRGSEFSFDGLDWNQAEGFLGLSQCLPQKILPALGERMDCLGCVQVPSI